MPVEAPVADWIYRFTKGKVDIVDPTTESDEDRNERIMRQRNDTQEADEREKKRALLDKAQATIDGFSETIRLANDLIIEYNNDEGKVVREKLLGPEHKAFEVEDLRGDKERNLKFFDASGKKEVAYSEAMKQAGTALALIMKEVENLAAVTTQRLKDPKDTSDKPVMETQKLFTDEEIAAEIFTPLLRENILAPTFVPDKWSETQKMLDGSDEYYIKECKEKGGEQATGAAALTKGVIQVTSQVVGTIFSGLGAPKSGQIDISSGEHISKNQEAVYTAMNAGITAVLSTGTDVVEKVYDLYRSGDLDGWKSVDFGKEINAIASGIGQIVTGATQNADLGGEVAIGIAASARFANLTKMLHEWGKQKDRSAKTFPWSDFLDEASGIALDGLNIKADNTSGDVSVAWSNVASETSAAVKTALSAQKAIMNTALGSGNWGDFVNIFATGMTEGAKMTTAILANNITFNLDSNYDPNAPTPTPTSPPTTKSGLDQEGSQLSSNVNLINGIDQITMKSNYDTASTSFSNEVGASGQQLATETGIDKLKSGSDALLKKLGGKKITFARTKSSEELQDKLKEIKAEADKLEQEKKAASTKQADRIKALLDKEQEEYQAALDCLGSTNPDDAEYKSIAKLIEKIEADRQFCDGLFAIFGGGIGAASGIASSVANLASEVLPALSAAGQLVKMMANAKAAYERITAYVAWNNSKKDAISANSVYYTTIKNFQTNMRNQSLQYSAQACANLIQLGLALGQMSPLAPAFKVAGSAVGAAAAAEDALYKFYQQQKLAEAWVLTKKAIDPDNAGNRKMRLLARKLNPTLAKYTIAYGALIKKDPIAIGALGRCNLDRETLTRATDKVADVKKYLETLYKDDGKVLVTIDYEKSAFKTPEVKLDARTWTLTYSMLAKEANLTTPNPPKAVTLLAQVEFARTNIERLPEPDPDDVETPKDQLAKIAESRATAQAQLRKALEGVEAVFRNFVPQGDKGLAAVKKVTDRYADEAAAALEALKLETSDPPDQAAVALAMIASAKQNATGVAVNPPKTDDEDDQTAPTIDPSIAQQQQQGRQETAQIRN